MKFLIIGAGSMGTRRVRTLLSLGYSPLDITIYDNDTKKAEDAAKKYDIWWYDVMPNLILNKFDAVIISVPPLLKQKYISMCNDAETPCFAEADVTEYSGNYAASATMRFHPAIQKIKELLYSGTLGKVYTFTHHCGNHIEDWHPGANKKTYYAMTKEAGGCKEIFPFELSWLSYLFGTPIDAYGMIDKKLDDPDISADDVYCAAVKFASGEECIDKIMFKKNALSPDELQKMVEELEQGKSVVEIPCKASEVSWTTKQPSITGTVLIDIVSRPAIRELRIAGSKANLIWNWDTDYIEIEQSNDEISMIFYPKGKAAEGYNENIPEFMYEQEMQNFIAAIQGKEQYLYPREDEKACISMLNELEVSCIKK
jgi:hypothetical protein